MKKNIIDDGCIYEDTTCHKCTYGVRRSMTKDEVWDMLVRLSKYQLNYVPNREHNGDKCIDFYDISYMNENGRLEKKLQSTVIHKSTYGMPRLSLHDESLPLTNIFYRVISEGIVNSENPWNVKLYDENIKTNATMIEYKHYDETSDYKDSSITVPIKDIWYTEMMEDLTLEYKTKCTLLTTTNVISFLFKKLFINTLDISIRSSFTESKDLNENEVKSSDMKYRVTFNFSKTYTGMKIKKERKLFMKACDNFIREVLPSIGR